MSSVYDLFKTNKHEDKTKRDRITNLPKGLNRQYKGCEKLKIKLREMAILI